MLLKTKTGGGMPYARKEDYEYDNKQYEADLKTGDIIKILDAGETETSSFGGEQTVFKIKTRNGDKRLSFNQATINVLIGEFGEDTESWVNKDVNVILHKKLIAGKKAIVPYLVTEGWNLDEYGELYKKGNNTGNPQQNQAQPQTTSDSPPEQPQTLTPPTSSTGTEEVKVEDIPF